MRFGWKMASGVALAMVLLGLAAPAEAVLPAARLTIHASTSAVGVGHIVRVTGGVRPLSPGAPLKLQRYSAGRWVQIAAARASSRSTYVFTIKPMVPGVQKVRVLASATSRYRATYSSVVSFRAFHVSTWRTLSAGNKYTCGVKTNGTAWCWGLNDHGQLGQTVNAGTLQPNPLPMQIAGSWASIAAGGDHTCGVRADGTGWCWGANNEGELGTATNSWTSNPNPVPTQVDGVWNAITAGGVDTCGVKSDASGWCWSSDQFGDLSSDQSDYQAGRPTLVEEPGTWSSLFAGGAETCGVKVSATAWCWGVDFLGESGNGNYGVATTNPTPTAVPGDWRGLAVGMYHVCGLRADGTAWCWGDNSSGELGQPPTTSRSTRRRWRYSADLSPCSIFPSRCVTGHLPCALCGQTADRSLGTHGRHAPARTRGRRLPR